MPPSNAASVSEYDGMIGKRDTYDISKCCDGYVRGMTKPAADCGMRCCNLDSNEMSTQPTFLRLGYPDLHILVGDPLLGNGCGSPNQI